MKIKNYEFSNSKVSKDTTIISINDLHSNKKTLLKKYLKILKTIEKENADYVAFVGDILDDSKNIDNNLHLFFNSLASIVNKVVVVKGNHDDLTKRLDFNKSLKWVEYVNNDFFDKINLIRNVFVLNNKNLYIKDCNINFIGLYLNGYKHYELAKEDERDFIKEVNNHFPNHFSSNYYNVLLCHSPQNVMNSKIINKIELLNTINLIISGHMHNGLIPYWLEKYVDLFLKLINDEYYKNRGLLSPSLEKFPCLTRGEIDFNGIKGIIGSPLTTISEDKTVLSKIVNSPLGVPAAINKIKILKR